MKTMKPSLTCARNIDEFTVSINNGNGALDYPTGLLTFDELLLASLPSCTETSTSYLEIDGIRFWTGTPSNYGFFGIHTSIEFTSCKNDSLFFEYTGVDSVAVRPSISLKPGTKIFSGDGTVNNPYTIITE